MNEWIMIMSELMAEYDKKYMLKIYYGQASEVIKALQKGIRIYWPHRNHMSGVQKKRIKSAVKLIRDLTNSDDS